MQLADILPIQAGHYFYKQISLKDGLPATIRCILTSDDFFIPTDEKGNIIWANSTCLIKDGVLFGSQNKVYYYSYQDSSLRLLRTFNQEPNFNITLMSLWDDHTLLCCSRWQGLLLLDLNTGEYSLPPFDCGKEIMNENKKRISIHP